MTLLSDIKVKSDIPYEEYRQGAHLPHLGLDPVGGLTTGVCDCDAWWSV